MCLAVPGEIKEIFEGEEDELARTGTIDFGGTRKEVNLAYVPEAEVGDYVLVHVGFAIQTIDEDEADHVFEYLEEIGELDDFEAEAGASGPISGASPS
jgi:hydrogenase expression/formation protein HypC